MDEQQVRDKFEEVCQIVFEDPALRIRDDMTAKDVENWDSLNHINLIVALEDAFGVRFATGEVANLQNVGEFIQLIQRKLG